MLRALGPGNGGSTWRRLWVLLVIGTIPAVLAALLLGDLIEESFSALWGRGSGLDCDRGAPLELPAADDERTWLLRLEGDRRSGGWFVSERGSTTGLSRSGSTIVGGLMRGLSHDSAARFSFLLSIPAILGAAVYDLPRVSLLEAEAVVGYVAGFASAFLVGYICIGVVLRLLAIGRFHLFGYYCLTAGGAVLVYITFNLP